MKLKRAIACALALNMLLMCGAVGHAETEGTVVAEENYQACAPGKYPQAASGIRYTVEKDSDNAENYVGRVTPASASAALINEFKFDAVSTKLSIAFSVRFAKKSGSEKLKLALSYAGKKKENFVLSAAGITGNKDNPVADRCDLSLVQSGLSDGAWHKVEFLLDVSGKTYTAAVDGKLKTPEEGYYLRNASFENITSGITGVSFSASGSGGAIFLDDIAITRMNAAKEETAAATGSANKLAARLGSSVMFYENSPMAYYGGLKGYADGVKGEAIPYIIGGKLYVPLGMIATNVKADAEGKAVTATLAKKPMNLTMGETEYQLNREKKTLQNAPVWNGAPYLAAEDAAELTGKTLYTDGNGLYGLMDTSNLDEKKDAETLETLRKNLNLASAPKEEADGVAQVFHKSGTVRPGETALLYGWNFDKQTKADISCTAADGTTQTQEVMPLKITKNSVMIAVPESFPMSVYAVTIKNARGASEAIMLNVADPWWFMADSYQKGTAGGWLYVMGDTLAFNEQGKIKLTKGSEEISLSVTEQDEYGIKAALPGSLAVGTYEIWVHNGLSGESWHKLDVIEIAAADNGHQSKYNVVDYGADPTGATDSGEAIQSAISTAAASGGTVYFPKGRYQFTQQLQILPGVTLEGEGKGLVSLFIPPGKPVPNIVFAATDDFTFKYIDLYIESDHNNILTARNNFKLLDCTFRVNAFYHQVKVNQAGGTYPYPAATKDTLELGFMIYATGSNFEVSGCDLLCSGQVFDLHDTANGIIRNSVLSSGKNPIQSYGTSKMLWENNTFQGAGLYSNGMMLSLYFDAAATYFNCFKNNTFRDFYGGDREAMTFDGHGTAYYGTMEKTEGTKMTLTESPHWGVSNKDMIYGWTMGFEKRDTEREWHGLTVYILDGKGAGQARNLVYCSENSIEIESPWDIEPDGSSIISIGKFNGRHIFDNNTFVDIGPSVQLYPPGYECIVSRNNITRSFSSNAGGHITNKMSWGGIRVEPNWFSQFVDNVVEQGNSWGAESFKLQMYGTNDMDNMPIGRGHILKRNVLKNNGYICLQGAVSDIIVEKNEVCETPRGIYLRNRQGNCPQDYLLKDNVFRNVDSEISFGQ